jgi:DHA1 family bicyclomycin/chloramphenicol resistance-like MFS transporter
MQRSSATVEVMTPRRTRTIKLALILGGLTAFGPLSIDMYLPAFPAMSTDLGATQSQIQLTLTACVLGVAFGQIIAGPLSDRLGRRRPLVVGLLVYAVASVLCALVTSVHALIALRLVQGLGAAAGIVIARATVRDLYSGADLARFFSALMLVSGLAPILAPVIGGQVLTVTTWEGVFLVLAGFGVLLLIATAFFLPDTLAERHRVRSNLGGLIRTFGHLLADRVFVGYALSSGMCFAAMFAYISGSSYVLQDVFALNPQQYAMVFGVNALGLVLTGQVNGRLVGRVTPRRLLGVGIGIGATASVALVTAAVAKLGLFGLLIPLFLLVSSVGLVIPNATALALTPHGNAAGSASALLGVLQFTIGGIAAPLVGLAESHSAVPMTAVMCAMSVSAVVLFLLLTSDRSTSESAPAAAPSTVDTDAVRAVET